MGKSDSSSSSSSSEDEAKQVAASSVAASSRAVEADGSDDEAASTIAAPPSDGSPEFIGYKISLDGALPPLLKEEDCEDDDMQLLEEERELLVLLLHARKLMGNLIKKSEDINAAKRGLNGDDPELLNLINILADLDNDEEGKDFIQQIQDLKALLSAEIRRNHNLDREAAHLDKKIALLIKNRGRLSQIKPRGRGRRSGKGANAGAQRVEVEPRKIANYQDMFYLLQTQPRYLARMIYMVNPDQMETFLDTTILTLYGDAYSPREEFLILRFFQLAIQHEISVISNLRDFMALETVVPKMVITYNRRKAGFEYLKRTFREPLEKFMKLEINSEINPMTIYTQMINEEEIRIGQRSQLPRDIPADQAIQNPTVAGIVAERVRVLQDTCELFLDAILRTRDSLPYGLRWICKQLHELIIKSLPSTTHDDILKLTGYFVYYRFINVAILNPDHKNIDQQIISEILSDASRRALMVVSKVMQNLFNFKPFGDDQNNFKPFNEFILAKKPVIAEYFESLIKVPDPEDHLQINSYMELTQKSKPVIQISLYEIFQTHALIHLHLDKVAPEREDPLRLIIQDLGDVPPADMINDSNDRDIQLTLTNRFKVDVEEEDPHQKLYAETKELLIPILRRVPIQESLTTPSLMDVLDWGINFAKAQNNEELNAQINQILENIHTLEREDLVSKDDNYESFVADVSQEVKNRNAIRAHQKKEIERLKMTLEKLRNHSLYLEDQKAQYKKYLEDCKKSLYSSAKPGKKQKGGSGALIGPFKFKYNDLAKRGIILDSEVPEGSRKRTSFSIVSKEPGTFEITAKIAGIKIDTMTLELDDLLEKHYNNQTRLALDQITLDVNLMIHLLNKHFINEKK